MILVNNMEGLIGDFLGTVPAMQRLVKEHGEIMVNINNDIWELYDMAKIDGILDFSHNLLHEPKFDITLSSGEAFQIASKLNCYMSSAFMVQAGFEQPKIPPKAKLNWTQTSIPGFKAHVCDYLISPFARSLPESQKWPKEKWVELFLRLPHKKFGILGNSKYDDLEYFAIDKGQPWYSNVVRIYDTPFNFLVELYKSVECLISVVTGTSHLAFHLGVKNILLTSQTMAWGNNPDAILIKKPIHDITVNEVLDKIYEQAENRLSNYIQH